MTRRSCGARSSRSDGEGIVEVQENTFFHSADPGDQSICGGDPVDQSNEKRLLGYPHSAVQPVDPGRILNSAYPMVSA